MHTDYDPERDRWHGDKPKKIAAGIVESGVDVFAITEHNKVSERFFDVEEEVNALLEDTEREVLALLGTELAVIFQGFRYHIGYVFEEKFTPHNLPDIPPPKLDAKSLEHYCMDYPGVAILNHPTWRDHRGVNHEDVTEDFMSSGLIDGVEILNGSILSNGTDKRIILSALEMFTKVRRARARVAAIGASDAHVGDLVGSVATRFCTAEKSEIFGAIRRAETRAIAITDSTRAKLKNAIGSSLAKNYTLNGLNKYLVMPT